MKGMTQTKHNNQVRSFKKKKRKKKRKRRKLEKIFYQKQSIQSLSLTR